MNAPKVKFNIIDSSFSVASQLTGISCVEGITLRGPFANKNNLLMSSWAQFTNLYGGYIPNSDFPLLCKRAFDLGAQLRINRVGHYTTITNASTLDAVKATMVSAFVITFSGALVISNVYNLTINGTGISPVTFATDSDTTMAAIATAIKASTFVQDAYIVPATATNVRKIIVQPKSNVSLVLTSSVVTSGASQATTTTTAQTAIADVNGNLICTATPKYEGADYNNLSIAISPASNGSTAYFNLSIQHAIEPLLNESYSNLTIMGNPSIANSHYLDSVITATQLMDFAYLDLSATTGQINPKAETYFYNSGTDGSTPVQVDYVGDPAGKNGFHAFDSVNDAFQIGAPEMSDTVIHTGGSAYTQARQDMVYFAHLSNNNTTDAAYISDRSVTNINSYFTAFYGGGLQVTDPTTGLVKNISELGDVFGIMAQNDAEPNGPWKQPAGVNRAVLSNVLGVVNNFGSNALYAQINNMANRQINMVVNSDNLIYINSGFTGTITDSKLSFLSTVRFLIWIKQSLSPTLKRYQQEPADIPTFKALFTEVEPFFLNLQTIGALAQGDGWAWQGDQDAKDLDSLTINKPADLDNGIYKIKLFLKTLTPIQDIEVNLIVTASGVSLEQPTQ